MTANPLCRIPKTLANAGVFAFSLWTSVPRLGARFGDNFAKFSLSFSGPVDFSIVKSTGRFQNSFQLKELRVVSGERFYGVNACPMGF